MSGLPASMAGDTTPRTLVLVADPFSTPVDGFLESAPETYPGLRVVGGLASAARGPGGNRLVLDEKVYTDGAVGVLLAPRDGATSVVSQGCRPIGQPLTVTKSEGSVIYELAGRPALERLGRPAREARTGRPRGSPSVGSTSVASSTSTRRTSAVVTSSSVPCSEATGRRRHRRGRRDRGRRDRAVPGARRRLRRRRPTRVAHRQAGQRRARVHLQRPRHASVRASPITMRR